MIIQGEPAIVKMNNAKENIVGEDIKSFLRVDERDMIQFQRSLVYIAVSKL